MDTYGGCCGSCVHLNINDYVGTKDRCKCTLRGGYHDLHERSCSKYDYDKYRDYYDLNHRWHIVSAIFNKLNLNDEYECINLLHNFRINFLENDSKYLDLLEEYDIIGPVIAECLTNDDNSILLCKNLIRHYLVDILDLIRNDENEKALSKYMEMFTILCFIYNNQIVEYKSKKLLKRK